MKRVKHCFPCASISWLWLASLLLVSPVVGQELTPLLAPDQVDVTGLQEIEHRILPPLMREGPAAHASLPEYYWAANQELKSRFEEARRVYEAGKPQRLRQVTLVAGSAGVGKTFLKRHVYGESYPAEHVCKFDIRELYTDWLQQGTVHEKPDLYNGNVVLSSMLAVKDKSQPLLLEYLQQQEARFFVIDSLDEIHPNEYAWVLQQVEEFALRGERDFVHVVVFGRSLSFIDYWRSADRVNNGEQVELFLLQPPQFRTTGDLLVSSWEYHTWNAKLQWSPGGAEPKAMPLTDYLRWHESGFSSGGPFSTVSHQADPSLNAHVQQTLENWCVSQREVGAVFYNLAGNGFLREIVTEHATQGLAYQQRRFMDAYIQAWLKRETKSENRPSAAKPEFLDLYLELLEEVAVKYWREGRVDQNGFFPVSDVDAISVRFRGEPTAFPVRRILDHSGLKHNDPRETGVTHYRFEPLWAHRLLIEYYNERQLREARAGEVSVVRGATSP